MRHLSRALSVSPARVDALDHVHHAYNHVTPVRRAALIRAIEDHVVVGCVSGDESLCQAFRWRLGALSIVLSVAVSETSSEP